MESLRLNIARVVYYGAVIISAWFFAVTALSVAALATYRPLAEVADNWPAIAWYTGVAIGIYAAGHARYLLIGR